MSNTAVIIYATNDKLHIGRSLELIAALSPRQVLSSIASAGYTAIITK